MKVNTVQTGRAEASKKKGYSSPKLKKWGKVADLTHSGTDTGGDGISASFGSG